MAKLNLTPATGPELQWIASFFLCQLFPYAFIQTHIQIVLQGLKTKQDFEQLKIPLQSPSEALIDLLGQKMPRTKYMFGPSWGNSLFLRARGKEVLNSKYMLKFHWNQYNGQWTGPQILHGKRLHCHFGCSVMNEGLSFCPGLADAESLLTFAITLRFRCPPRSAKATAEMPGAASPATPALPAASPA